MLADSAENNMIMGSSAAENGIGRYGQENTVDGNKGGKIPGQKAIFKETKNRMDRKD